MFRAGEIVRCVDSGTHTSLTKGNEYTVLASTHSNTRVKIVGKLGYEYHASRFASLSETQVSSDNYYKWLSGNRVRKFNDIS